MAAKHKKNVKFRVSVIDNEGKEVFLSDKRPDTSEEPVYKRIRISFINAGTIVIDENDWDDYEIYDGFLVIKKGDSWVALYNMKEIFSVVLEK